MIASFCELAGIQSLTGFRALHITRDLAALRAFVNCQIRGLTRCKNTLRSGNDQTVFEFQTAKGVVMRNLLIAVALASCLALSGAVGVTAQKKKKRSLQPQRGVTSQHQGLQPEAKAKANEIAAMFLTKCGDSYFGRHGGSIMEWRGLHVVVKRNNPTAADKLNGIEWSGDVFLQFDAQRFVDCPRCGTAWQSRAGGFCLSLKKKNGTWDIQPCLEFQRDLYGGVPPEHKVSCEQIGQLTRVIRE